MDATQIQYAPVNPQERRRLRARQLLRRFAPLLILLAMSPVLYKCGMTAWRRSQMLYWQRKAMVYMRPPGSIALDYTPPGSGVTSVEWRRLNPGRRAATTLFLHELKNEKGESRLVAIENTPFLAWISVVAPGSALREPKEVYEAQGALINHVEAGLKPGMKIVVFAGQPDSGDSSHFTIDCQIGEKTYTIDGYLAADDVITFSTREKK